MNLHRPVDAEPTLEEENELFEMANLYPEDTGLPMTIRVSPEGHARHDARVKVCMTHGNRMTLDNTAVVTVRPEPTVVQGTLTTKDERLVADWNGKNQATLIACWNGDIRTRALMQALVDV